MHYQDSPGFFRGFFPLFIPLNCINILLETYHVTYTIARSILASACDQKPTNLKEAPEYLHGKYIGMYH